MCYHKRCRQEYLTEATRMWPQVTTRFYRYDNQKQLNYVFSIEAWK